MHNLVLLCRRHHRSVHEGLFSVHRCVDGEVTFCRPDGTPVAMTPPESRAHGSLAAEPCRVAELPVWDGARFDLTWAIDVLYKPVEPGCCRADAVRRAWIQPVATSRPKVR